MNTHFTFTPAIVRSLMEIESAREAVRLTVLPPQVVERLRQEARVRSTHYSTRIEGNRLTLVEAEQAVLAGRRFPGRERDVREVQNYYRALQRVEEWVEQQVPITAELIRRLHALIFRGPRSQPTPYRDGQNVVRDTVSGELIYMPPEAGDVPGLVADLAVWIAQAEQEGLPVPVVAGLAHYQFVTIHPFYDGNGRTARALATLILYRHGYDLGRFYSLEEFYAQDLAAYYAAPFALGRPPGTRGPGSTPGPRNWSSIDGALPTHPHHNYYMGRAEAGLTEWLAYFLSGMTATFHGVVEKVRAQAQTADAAAVVRLLAAEGLITPPPGRSDVSPVSEEELAAAAERLGRAPGRPLSEIIIEDRGDM